MTDAVRFVREAFYFNYAAARAFGSEPEDLAEFFAEHAAEYEARWQRGEIPA